MKITMRIYESDHGSHIIEAREDGTFWCDDHDDYFPVSQPFDVDVIMLPAEDVTERRIDGLEKAKAKAHANWLTVAATFDDKIAKLRAIPHILPSLIGLLKDETDE